jgi:SAM-dependent methyltransferase
VSSTHGETIRGRARSWLKGVYYSRSFRALAYAPADAYDRLRGRRDPLTPPRRLQYVGRAADFEAVGADWRQRLVRDHGLRPDSDVLDIGCGVGRAAVALIPELRTGSYEGFDVVPQFIRWCSREITARHPRFRFRLADVGNRQYNRGGDSAPARFTFPYADESFDIALAASVFTHMEPDGIRRYLDETRRVLRPGGALVCTFFLVDDEVERLLPLRRAAFALDHELSDAEGSRYRAADRRVPEYCVGVYERSLLADLAASDLELEATERGWWSGREVGPAAPYQDLLRLRRPG